MSDPRIFISHKTIDNSNNKASHLRSELLRKGFQHVFLDIFSLEAGDNWRQTLLDHLADIDVLIVLIEEATEDSAWVQREVDMARGAGTSILPVLVDTDYAAVKGALDRLDMNEKQYIQWDNRHLDDIIDRIDDLTRETRDRQEQLCEKWGLRRQEKELADHDPYLHTFAHIDIAGVQFHIAGGDATARMRYSSTQKITTCKWHASTRITRSRAMSAWKGHTFIPQPGLFWKTPYRKSCTNR